MNKVNLFLIGPIKSGTTSLSSYFNQIQDVYVPIVKENHFFTDLVNVKFKDTTMQLPQSARHSFQISKITNYFFRQIEILSIFLMLALHIL